MSRRRRRTFMAAVVVVLGSLAASVAAGGMTPSASVTTTIQGWESWLRLDWTTQVRPNGQEIDGYLYSKYGSTIFNVQLLAQGLDGAGNVMHQKIAWVPGTVPSLQRAYFRIPEMPQADRYRVTVWAFDFVQSKTMP